MRYAKIGYHRQIRCNSMVRSLNKQETVNILLSNADWAWPQAVRDIFHPLGVNALVADSAEDMVRLVDSNRIHLAILDRVIGNLSGLQTLKMLRQRDRMLPCILLANTVNDELLRQALALRAFSVITKPVDLDVLQKQIDRLFVKMYDNDMFSPAPADGAPRMIQGGSPTIVRKKTIIHWIFKRIGKEHD